MPQVVVYMPSDEPAEGYKATYFVRMQKVIEARGFKTFDLG
jgi:hypothetical protein